MIIPHDVGASFSCNPNQPTVTVKYRRQCHHEIHNLPGKRGMNELFMALSTWICVCIFHKLKDRGDLSESIHDVEAVISRGHSSQSVGFFDFSK